MALRIEQITVDSPDPARIATWWTDVLGYEIIYRTEPGDQEDWEVEIAPRGSASGPNILFIKVPDPKASKNRWHLDLRPDDQAAEVERLERLGAKRVDVGQGSDVTWVVFADPDGNEFCVLRALENA